MRFSKKTIQHNCDVWNISLKKRWGQNFLIDTFTIDRIVAMIFGLVSSEKKTIDIWEIGPGMGAVTHSLIADAKIRHLMLFEIDHGLIRFLHEIFSEEIQNKTVSIISGDADKTVPSAFQNESSAMPDCVFGNLPYSTGVRMILSWILQGMFSIPMCVMLQKEVIQRMMAQPHSKLYGIQSVIIQSVYTIRSEGLVSRNCFYPSPHVDSLLCTLSPKKDGLIPSVACMKVLITLLRVSFVSRRKMLKNTLYKYLDDHYNSKAILDVVDIDFSQRPEQIAVSEYVRIAYACIS